MSNPTSGNILIHIYNEQIILTIVQLEVTYLNGMVGYLTVNSSSNSSKALISDCDCFRNFVFRVKLAGGSP